LNEFSGGYQTTNRKEEDIGDDLKRDGNISSLKNGIGTGQWT
jgi:hypothetical protein